MKKAVFLLGIVLSVLPAAWAAGKNEAWLQVRSPHFVVVTDGNEKQARKVADQFERMRAVFQKAFPSLSLDSFAPITVIAVRGEKQFRELEPTAYLAKGSLKLGGLFQRAEEKNYILLRLDIEGQHPYEVVYHEYTHLLTSKGAEFMPLWLTEGLAEFYEDTEIEGNDVLLGEPSGANLMLLREQHVLPLQVLFTVDHSSPYYHEENKGSIFYAESWALTHMLLTEDFKSNGHRVQTYLGLLERKTDPIEAATQAFGDLKQFQTALGQYLSRPTYTVLKMHSTISTKDLEYKVEPITATQADAVRADFLACEGREEDARALLKDVVQQDAKNVTALETMGFLEGRSGHVAEARKWYEEAVKLDSQSYLANYNFAVLSMNSATTPEQQQAVEGSLRAAIKINPHFAPAYDRLAVFYAMQHTNLEEARRLTLYAVSYEPDVVAFRVNSANILMEMKRPADAISVLEAALKVARNEQEKDMVEGALDSAKSYQAALESGRQLRAMDTHQDTSASAPVLRRAASPVEGAGDAPHQPDPETSFPPAGPRRELTGTVHSVACSYPAVLKLQLVSGERTLALQSRNYYKIEFSALNFTPAGELHPCSDLEGMKAKIKYVEAGDGGEIVAVQLSK